MGRPIRDRRSRLEGVVVSDDRVAQGADEGRPHVLRGLMQLRLEANTQNPSFLLDLLALLRFKPG